MNKNEGLLDRSDTAETNSAGFECHRTLVLAMGVSPLVSINQLAWAGEPVNINLPSAEAIAKALSGVGSAKVDRIVEYSEAYVPFEHVDELAAVQGIGQAMVEKTAMPCFCTNSQGSTPHCFF